MNDPPQQHVSPEPHPRATVPSAGRVGQATAWTGVLASRLGLALPSRHRQAVQLTLRSHQLFEQAQLASGSTFAPEDTAALVRKALDQLVAAVLSLDGDVPRSDQECRARLVASDSLRQLFGDVVDDLAWLDELATARECDPRREDPGASGRYLGLLARLPRLYRKVQLHLQARQRVDGVRVTARRVLGGAALLAAAVALSVPYLLTGPDRSTRSGSESAAQVRVTPGPAEPREVLDDPQRCFEATYFATPDFHRPVTTRRECAIELDWATAPEASIPALPADSFSVRWRGVLQVPASEIYVFFLASDHGSRLYLDDQLIIDNWGNHGLQERASTPMPLRAGEAHSLRVEYQAGHRAAVQLLWRSSTIDKRTLSGRFVGRPEPAGDDDGNVAHRAAGSRH